MNLDFLFFNGHGVFVLPAFIFTLMSFLVLYIKTSKELKKQENIYSKEYKQLIEIKIRSAKDKEIIEQAFSTNSV